MEDKEKSTQCSPMEKIPERITFPEMEKEILKYWEKIDAFQTSLKRSEGLPEYSFYDGPPFATGLPHYGHILAGTIKDIVPRYAHMTGHHVTRRFGWDCHGLPIEFEIDKIRGIKTRQDVLNLPGGIAEYNEECRKIVMRFSKEWEAIVSRLGRWIDFSNDYKTMDKSFMESVWWVFSKLWSKELVYRGFKVMPYSTACGTPLSNFEAGMDYRDVNDPAIIISFPLVDEPETNLLAWTTTPWTLPSNLALAVHPNLEYVKLKDKETGNIYVVCNRRLSSLYPLSKKQRQQQAKTQGQPAAKQEAQSAAKEEGAAGEGGDAKKAGPAQQRQQKGGRKHKGSSKPAEKKEEEEKEAVDTSKFEVLQTFTGKELAGKRYIPPFDYFEKERANGAFTVVLGDYVTDDSGTGIVHCAPAFGEDDFNVCVANGLIKKGGEGITCPVDDNGQFTEQVSHYAGVHVKVADEQIMKDLKEKKRLVQKGTINHAYPFCWRSSTPLIYKAVPCWFVRVEQLASRLMENNDKTYWVPEFVKTKRFHNWLKDAKDWAVSRNRFWGTPIPLWVNPDDPEERVCIGSIAELEKLSGRTGLTDIHRHFVDDITIPSKDGKGVLRRVDEVFDCWFESGSMPYAQIHYPFENEELFNKSFPADFIAEGIDQTRGWFYTLLVLSTAIFDKPAWKNLVVNGLVLASDGKKMSKRLKNYPEPTVVVENYGADSVRVYLISSPAVHGDDLKFSEAGVQEVLKDVFLPWFNAYRFFGQSMDQLYLSGREFKLDAEIAHSSPNIMDRWVLSALQTLLKFVKQEMAAYRLYTVVPKLLGFINQLTNWYIRFNRKRLKGREGHEEQLRSLNALFETLQTLSRAMAPFTPFFTDYLYQNLRNVLPKEQREDSVHYLSFPEPNDKLFNEEIERAISDFQQVIELGRRARDRRTVPLKYPLRELTIISADKTVLKNLHDLKGYIEEELNVKELKVTSDEKEYVQTRADPVRDRLGRRLRKDMGKVCKAIQALSHEEISNFRQNGKITIEGHDLTLEDITITREFKGEKDKYEAQWTSSALVVLSITIDTELQEEGFMREIINRVQRLRKEAGLSVGDPVETFFDSKDATLVKVARERADELVKTLLIPLLPVQWKPSHAAEITHSELSIKGSDGKLELWITKKVVSFDDAKLKAKLGSDERVAEAKKEVLGLEWSAVESGGKTLAVGENKVQLVLGEDYFLTAHARSLAGSQ